jgi:hypothetical protein
MRGIFKVVFVIISSLAARGRRIPGSRALNRIRADRLLNRVKTRNASQRASTNGSYSSPSRARVEFDSLRRATTSD